MICFFLPWRLLVSEGRFVNLFGNFSPLCAVRTPLLVTTRGLYILNPLFEGQKRFFVKFWPYVRLAFKRGLWWSVCGICLVFSICMILASFQYHQFWSNHASSDTQLSLHLQTKWSSLRIRVTSSKFHPPKDTGSIQITACSGQMIILN